MNGDFDPATKDDIHAKALELKLHPWFEHSATEDIEQELGLDLLKRRAKFNPGLSDWVTFRRAVLRNKSACMIQAQSRIAPTMRRREVSLNTPLSDEDSADPYMDELGDTIPDSHPSAIDASCLKLDVETLMAKLPPLLRRAAELLKTRTQTDTATELGLSRTEFRRRCLVPLQSAFQALA